MSLEKTFLELKEKMEGEAMTLSEKYGANDREEAIEAYASYLLSASYICAGGDDQDFWSWLTQKDCFFPCAGDVHWASRKDLKQVDADFHRIHQAFPEIRGEAIELIVTNSKDNQKQFSFKSVFECKDEKGNLIDCTKQISIMKSAVKHLKDVAVHFRNGYVNDHIANEDGWYQEFLNVEVYALSEVELLMAKKALKKFMKEGCE